MYGTSIYNSLLMAGTMTDSVKSDSGKKDPPYPGESPTRPEFDAWVKAFNNLVLAEGDGFPSRNTRKDSSFVDRHLGRDSHG